MLVTARSVSVVFMLGAYLPCRRALGRSCTTVANPLYKCWCPVHLLMTKQSQMVRRMFVMDMSYSWGLKSHLWGLQWVNKLKPSALALWKQSNGKGSSPGCCWAHCLLCSERLWPEKWCCFLGKPNSTLWITFFFPSPCWHLFPPTKGRPGLSPLLHHCNPCAGAGLPSSSWFVPL